MASSDLVHVLIELVSPLFIALPVSYISVKLALRKFKSEKWWDKQLQCYSDISESLSRIIIYSDMVFDIELDAISHDDSVFSAQKVSFNEAFFNLQSHAYSSSILLDEHSYKAVQVFSNKLFRIETSTIDIQKLGVLREDAEHCLFVVNSNARKALGV